MGINRLKHVQQDLVLSKLHCVAVPMKTDRRPNQRRWHMRADEQHATKYRCVLNAESNCEVVTSALWHQRVRR